MTPASRIKVKRDGPRGWHWIAAANFDPALHQVVEDDPQQPPKQAETAAEPKRRGRPPKARDTNPTNGA